MAEKRDYYEVLGIGKNATDAEIRRAPTANLPKSTTLT